VREKQKQQELQLEQHMRKQHEQRVTAHFSTVTQQKQLLQYPQYQHHHQKIIEQQQHLQQQQQLQLLQEQEQEQELIDPEGEESNPSYYWQLSGEQALEQRDERFEAFVTVTSVEKETGNLQQNNLRYASTYVLNQLKY
jgi:hypothetical protein